MSELDVRINLVDRVDYRTEYIRILGLIKQIPSVISFVLIL